MLVVVFEDERSGTVCEAWSACVYIELVWHGSVVSWKGERGMASTGWIEHLMRSAMIFVEHLEMLVCSSVKAKLRSASQVLWSGLRMKEECEKTSVISKSSGDQLN